MMLTVTGGGGGLHWTRGVMKCLYRYSGKGKERGLNDLQFRTKVCTYDSYTLQGLIGSASISVLYVFMETKLHR